MASNRTRLILKTAAATLFLAAVAAALGGFIVHRAGWYNIGATAQHLQPVHTLLEEGELRLPALTPTAYAEITARGRIALTQCACHACHMIPGVTGSEMYVGRPLAGLGERKFIAGGLPNTMPVLDVTEADAVDMSAYLLTRR